MPAADRPVCSAPASRGRLQLFDLCQLAHCHLLHHIQHRFLSDFANLYELHAPKISRSWNPVHPLQVAGAYNL